MYLHKLIVEGFKSYSERVEVDFSPEIAVIIGSNGVGKSNALDAIVWALGENNAHSLRAFSDADLMFSGSKLAPAASRASVELKFMKNDAEELSVRRERLFTGEELFFIDDTSYELLEDFRTGLFSQGLGKARLNIVRQDQLTDFLSLGPLERLSFIEKFGVNHQQIDTLNSSFSHFLSELIPDSRASLVINGQLGKGPFIEVFFPDKGLKRDLQLSGGERAVTLLALKLALFDQNPSPMYMLDEVEPSLDWTKNHSMQDLLKKMSARQQLIMVTHLQSTIQMAKTVHGVRIRPDGSSWLKFHFLMDKRLFKVYKCC
jgi:chromosome segregation protein